jgi:hypothetical protein
MIYLHEFYKHAMYDALRRSKAWYILKNLD